MATSAENSYAPSRVLLTKILAIPTQTQQQKVRKLENQEMREVDRDENLPETFRTHEELNQCQKRVIII